MPASLVLHRPAPQVEREPTFSAYHLRLAAAGGACLFGQVVDGRMMISPIGRIAYAEWLRLALLPRSLRLDTFVLMPNHLHAIVLARPSLGDAPRSPPAGRALAAVIAAYKTESTLRINQARGVPGAPVWQRNYQEQLLRDEREIQDARRRLSENPLRWRDAGGKAPGV